MFSPYPWNRSDLRHASTRPDSQIRRDIRQAGEHPDSSPHPARTGMRRCMKTGTVIMPISIRRVPHKHSAGGYHGKCGPTHPIFSWKNNFCGIHNPNGGGIGEIPFLPGGKAAFRNTGQAVSGELDSTGGIQKDSGKRGSFYRVAFQNDIAMSRKNIPVGRQLYKN